MSFGIVVHLEDPLGLGFDNANHGLYLIMHFAFYANWKINRKHMHTT